MEEHQQFVEGTDAVVRCPANFGTNPDSVEMKWNRDGQPVSREGRFFPKNESLRIQSVQSEDSGMYKCLLLGSNGAQIFGQKDIRVEVLPQSEDAPKINGAIRKLEVMYGDPLNLRCELVNSPDNVTYSWTIDTKFEHDILKNTQSVFHRNTRKFVGGRYTCRAENRHGYSETDFIVRINGK